MELPRGIEFRTKLDGPSMALCVKLIELLDELNNYNPAFKPVAVGMSDPVVVGGNSTPSVWFRVLNSPLEWQLRVAVNSFRGRKYVVMSNFSFMDYRDTLDVNPFGATLGTYCIDWEI